MARKKLQQRQYNAKPQLYAEQVRTVASQHALPPPPRLPSPPLPLMLAVLAAALETTEVNAKAGAHAHRQHAKIE
eukprot:1161299-Pelagomonas_calceolata.AAC.12